MTFYGKADIIAVERNAGTQASGKTRGESHMEALSVKFSILAGLFGVVGLIGLAALLASIIWLIIRVANFDSMLPALACVLLSLALTVGGLAVSPTLEAVQTGPALWEAPLESLKDRLGSLQDNGPWARFFKDKDAPEDGAPQDEGPAEEGGAPSPEEGAKRE